MKIFLQIIAFTFLVSFFGSNARAQCIEVEELYTFADSSELNWDTLFFKTDALNEFKEGFSNMDKGVSFMTPLIVNHIRLFHPKCAIRKDIVEFKNIVQVYNYLHEKNYSSDSLSVESTCNKVINDFRRFCREDSSCGKMMIFIFDSGPYFGEKVSKLHTKFSVADSLDIGIGKVFSLTDSDGEYLAFSTKNNDYEWVFKATECMPASNTFSKFSKNSLGFIVRLGLGDFATRLYLDNKGRFRFYICELD